MQRGEASLPGAPVGPPLEQLGARQGQDIDGDVPAPFEEVVHEIDEPGVREMEVLEHEDNRRGGGQPFEEGPPRREQLLRPRGRGLDSQERKEGGLDPAALVGVGDVRRERFGDLRPRGRLVVRLEQAAAHADHLPERPERDPVPVCG